MRVALVNSTTFQVENILEFPDDYDFDAEGAYEAPLGQEIQIDLEGLAQIGGTFTGSSWEPPPTPEPPEVIVFANIQEQMDNLLDVMVGKGSLTPQQASSVKVKPT